MRPTCWAGSDRIEAKRREDLALCLRTVPSQILDSLSPDRSPTVSGRATHFLRIFSFCRATRPVGVRY